MTSRHWSSESPTPASGSRCNPKASGASCPPTWTYRRTASSRRRSPTCCATRRRQHANIRIAYTPSAIELEVTDDGIGPPTDGRIVDGHGLEGMQERAALLGGELTWGPATGRGYKLQAVLPAMSDALRVVIADDQELIRAGFKALLEGRGIQVVAQAARRNRGR